MDRSTSSEAPGVRVTVHAGSPLAEVFLIDHEFALVRRSIGDLDARVKPGVYKVKARLADADAERLVVCDRDLDVDLSAELRVSSPAPLAGAVRTSAPEVHLARDLASRTPSRLEARAEQEAEILLMSRWSEGMPWEPLGASLHRADGAQVDFDDVVRTPLADGKLGRVAPGPYFLRWHTPVGVGVAQAIHAVAGWQTQVFASLDPGNVDDLGRARLSVLMSRAGFDPDSEEPRRTEELRTALADERKVASSALDALLERFEGPMLGLFGAHLMLVARDAVQRRASRARPSAPVHFDAIRFARVVAVLRDMLGSGHPDVVALSTQVEGGGMAPVGSVLAPPMLWRSWVLLLEASNDQPSLVPAEVWRQAAAPLPLRPFLMWAVEPDDAAQRVEGMVAEALSRGRGSGPDVRRDLTGRLLVPRAVVDALAERT